MARKQVRDPHTKSSRSVARAPAQRPDAAKTPGEPAARPTAPPAAPPFLLRPGLIENRFPTVALVGRPNVGKSSLFNALLKHEVAITDARAGTTRDRLLHPVTFDGKPCDLLDTGGIGLQGKERLAELVEMQVDAAIEAATVHALVVDAKEGLTPLDRQVAARLRARGGSVIVVVNKSEGRAAGWTAGEFAALGFETLVSTSAIHRLGLDELEQALGRLLPGGGEAGEGAARRDWEGLPKLAVVGRRNVGKSTFVNALARQERAMVSDLAGTTRDALDLLLEKDHRRFVLIDTAGLRRIKEPKGPVEFFSRVRTERAIRRADVVLLMFEAREGISTTDRKTADLILEERRPCVLVVNKWDRAEGAVTGNYAEYIAQRLPSLRHAPVCFTSAKHARRCWQTLDVALELYDLARTKIATPALNKAVERAEREHEPPVKKHRKPRLLYAVQVACGPPAFVIYCRHPKFIDAKYRRYLSKRLAAYLHLEEIPLRIFLREAPRKERS